MNSNRKHRRHKMLHSLVAESLESRQLFASWPAFGIVGSDDEAVVRPGIETSIPVTRNDGNGAVVLSVESPKFGSVTISSDGSEILYRSPSNFEGLDQFVYRYSTAEGMEGEAQVDILVAEPILAVNDWFLIDHELSPVKLDVLRNDRFNFNTGWSSFGDVVALGGNPAFDSKPNLEIVSAEITSPSAAGSIRIAEDKKSLIYEPSDGFVGVASVVYRVTDADGFSAEGRVDLRVVDEGTDPDQVARERLRQQLLENAVAQQEHLFGSSANRFWWGGIDPQLPDIPPVLNSGSLDTSGTGNSDVRDFSETNVQIAGVDEGDLVKTDGEFVYFLSNQILGGEESQVVIVDVRDPAKPLVVSRVSLVGELIEQYLIGDILSVTASLENSTAVTLLDVRDRTNPKILQTTSIPGQLRGSRGIADRLHFVTTLYEHQVSPPIEFIPIEEDQGNKEIDQVGLSSGQKPKSPLVNGDDIVLGTGPRGFYETGRQYVERITSELLDGVSIVTRDSKGVVIDSQLIDVHQMLDSDQRWSQTSFVSLDAIPGSPSEPPRIEVVSAAVEPSQIFVTAQSAYLLANSYDSEHQNQITEVEKFSLDETVKSVAVGSVVGFLLNQFSAGEHEGRLQIATTSWNQEGLENRVTVLEEQAGKLTVVGELTGIAPGEKIYSARFYGDRAFVVTFRQVDPLFVLDMSDPTAPAVVGELKIPGYSQYLQLVGPDLLLGIGRDADPETGAFDGLQVSLFDLSNPSAPVLRDQHEFAGGRETFSPLADAWNLSDHHAVSFFDSHDVLALPIFRSAFQPWFNWRLPLLINGSVDDEQSEKFSSSVQVLRVNDEVGIDVIGEVPFADSQALRSLRIGEHLFALSRTELKVTKIDAPQTVLGSVYIGGGATDNAVVVRAGRPVRINLIGNDAIYPSSVIHAIGVGQGPVEVTEDGHTVLYTPPMDFFGEDQFTYSVTGMEGHREAATTRITVLWNWHNVEFPNDVNRDGRVTPLDALRLINVLNLHGNMTIEECDAFDEVFRSFHPDVNDDGQVAPLDLLIVINELNRAAELLRAPAPEPDVYAIPFWLENEEEQFLQ